MGSELYQENATGLSSPSDDSKQDAKKGHKKRRAAVCVLSAVLIVLIILFGAVVGVFSHYYSLMDTDSCDYDYSKAVSITDEEMKEAAGGNVALPEENVYSERNVVNILLIGTDERTEKFDPYARADSIMILSLNKKTHAVKLVSLERGMTVSMPGKKHDLLTHTFHYGGAKLVMETVRTHFNLDAERYIRVNFSVFEKLIDYIGGVDISLSAEEAAALNKMLENKVTEGSNHLDGYSALQYSRLRSIDSDWQRIQRQRKVIASIKSIFRDKSILELDQIANDCLPYVQTNLTSMEFADLMFNMSGYVNGDFKEMTLPQKNTYKNLGDVDFEANSRILREFLYK